MLRQDVHFAERNFSEICCITEVEKAAEMYSYSSKRKREDELLAVPNVSGRQGMNFRTSPVISGTYIETEPRHQLFVPSTVGSGFQSSGATRIPDRVEVCETNRLLSDDQIQRFISSTVLPHHRTLTNSEGVSWSQAPPDNRPAPPSLQKKIKTLNHAYPNLVEDLQRRPVPQGNPVLLSVPQGTQRGFQENRVNFNQKTQGMPTGFPNEFSVPQGRQEFLIPQAKQEKVFSIPLSTGAQVVNGYQEDISYDNRMSEGISKFPQGTQDKISSFPQSSQGKVSRDPMLTTDIFQDTSVTNARKGETTDFPKGTLSLYHGTSGSEEIEDDIIIVHQETPEDLISVVQETLQEIMGIDHRNSISQGTAEEVMGIPNQITVYDETGKEITGFTPETMEEIMGITQEIMIPQGSVEEIMGIPKGITIPQETLHEIMGIMASVPDETLQEIMGFPQEIAVLQGTQGQASPVQNQNKYKGNNGVGCQDQSFWKSHSEMAPTTDVSAQHQLSPSYNQSQTNNERSIVKDSMNPDYQVNGSCRKRRREASGEDTSRKRQRRDQTANPDT
ncbi:uncharacterized protein LOC111107382 isoform X2 [Crassostrea virginica]